MSAIFPGVSEPVPKGYRGGTHRTIAPAETVRRLEPLLRPLGITRVANVTGLDVLGIPVVVVCRPNSRSLSVAQGKGLTLDAAKASGLMESIEFYHAERITLPLKLASYQELRFSHDVVDVYTLDRPEGSVYDDRLRLLWIEGFDLAAHEPIWLPYELVHMDCTVPMPAGSGCFHLSSNGLASGNHVLEAISQAICEVVERDNYARWSWLDEPTRAATLLDLTSVDDPHCIEILRRFERAGFGLAIWDMTIGVQVPTFRALVWERTPRPNGARGTSAGMGCHPTRAVALLRALTEAAQTRASWISGARDDLFRKDFDAMWTSREIPVEAHRATEGTTAGCAVGALQDVPSVELDTFDGEVRWLLQRLEDVGTGRVIAVDLTDPGLRIAVVRVAIPGLQHLEPSGTAPTRSNVHALTRRPG